MLSLPSKLSQRSVEFITILAYMVSILACFFFLLNPFFGILEPIPDNIPGVGNLDEVAELYFIYWAWPRLEAAIREFRKPIPKDENHRLDEVNYIDVQAEVLKAEGRDE